MSEVTGELLDPALVILLYSWSELLPYISKHFVSPLSSPLYNVIIALHWNYLCFMFSGAIPILVIEIISAESSIKSFIYIAK